LEADADAAVAEREAVAAGEGTEPVRGVGAALTLVAVRARRVAKSNCIKI
jgi:hypothetical protein